MIPNLADARAPAEFRALFRSPRAPGDHCVVDGNLAPQARLIRRLEQRQVPGQDESLLIQGPVLEHGDRGPHVVDVAAAVLGRPTRVGTFLSI